MQAHTRRLAQDIGTISAIILCFLNVGYGTTASTPISATGEVSDPKATVTLTIKSATSKFWTGGGYEGPILEDVNGTKYPEWSDGKSLVLAPGKQTVLMDYFAAKGKLGPGMSVVVAGAIKIGRATVIFEAVASHRYLLQYTVTHGGRGPHDLRLEVTDSSTGQVVARSLNFGEPSTATAGDENIGEIAYSILVPAGWNATQVKIAISAALIGRGWTVKSATDDRVVGYIKLRSNEATVTLKYNTTQIDAFCVGWVINKKTGARIRPEQPEGWLGYVKEDINRRLSNAPLTN